MPVAIEMLVDFLHLETELHINFFTFFEKVIIFHISSLLMKE